MTGRGPRGHAREDGVTCPAVWELRVRAAGQETLGVGRAGGLLGWGGEPGHPRKGRGAGSRRTQGQGRAEW